MYQTTSGQSLWLIKLFYNVILICIPKGFLILFLVMFFKYIYSEKNEETQIVLVGQYVRMGLAEAP